MEYNKNSPFQLDEYRHMQRSIPGVDGLYRCVRAIVDAKLDHDAQILVVGAGGGREIETLAQSEKQYRITGIDPSADMLAMAQHYADNAPQPERIILLQSTVETMPSTRFHAATSLLVMHFLPDDGQKLAYLKEIRARLLKGAVFIHADVSFPSRKEFEETLPIFLNHAELAGLPREKASIGPQVISTMPIISEARTRELFAQAGFVNVTRFFTGLWYLSWWMEAA